MLQILDTSSPGSTLAIPSLPLLHLSTGFTLVLCSVPMGWTKLSAGLDSLISSTLTVPLCPTYNCFQPDLGRDLSSCCPQLLIVSELRDALQDLNLCVSHPQHLPPVHLPSTLLCPTLWPSWKTPWNEQNIAKIQISPNNREILSGSH